MILENRKFKRKDVHGNVSGRMVLIEHLEILDLSLSGIRFNCLKKVDTNSIHRVKIQKNNVSVDIKGRVVRSILKKMQEKKEKQIPVYEVAMNFENLPDCEKRSLEELISIIGNE